MSNYFVDGAMTPVYLYLGMFGVVIFFGVLSVVLVCLRKP